MTAVLKEILPQEGTSIPGAGEYIPESLDLGPQSNSGEGDRTAQ